MFGNRKLFRDGAQISGVLTESDDSKAYTNSAGSYHVKVHVTFDDGTTADFDDKIHTKNGLHGLGATVPVRYDPADRSKIAIDEPLMGEQLKTARAQREAAFAAIADAPPLPGDPAAQLQALWEQRKVLDARGSELRRTGAPREEVGAWVAEREALDSRFRTLKLDHPEWTPT